MNLAMCEVPVHPVQFLSESDLTALPVLPMTQDSDGTYFCDGESTQDGTPSPDNPVPIVNTYPAGTYKAICGGKIYKVVLEDDLRSVPGVADRVRIDAGRGVCWVEKKVNVYTITGNENWGNYFYPTILTNINIPKGIFGTHIISNYCTGSLDKSFNYSNKTGTYFGFGKCDTYWNFANADECKAWLKEKYDSGNPMYFYYALADPTTHQSVPTQLTTISSGRSVTIPNTVNDAVDMLAVKGDSWQLVQEEITDEEGNVTQPAMPSPEYPSEIVSVEGEMESSGWNLFDVEKAKYTSNWIISTVQYAYSNFPVYVGKGNKFTVSYDGQLETGINMYVGIVLNEDGKIQRWMYHMSDNDLISNFYTETAKEDYVWIRCSTGHHLRMLEHFKNLQVTLSDSKKPYDRHRGNSITLPTLRSLPDGTADVLYVDRRNKRAWVERCVGEKVFDGSEDENWKVDSNNGFRISVSDMKKGKVLDGYCNRFRSNIGFSRQCIMFGYNSSVLYFPETFDISETVDDWKSWLSSNPVTVLYPLAESVIEELEYSDYLLETAQYETNIRINCDEHLEPEVSATVKILGR